MTELSPAEVFIRPAATVILARDSADGVEVLMVRRNSSATFMGGAHVSPGGTLDDTDRSELARAAAIEVKRIEPRPILEGNGSIRFLVPGNPGFEGTVS